MPAKAVARTQAAAPENTASPGAAPAVDSGVDPIASRHAAETILWVDDVTVSFDGFKALDRPHA